MEVCHMRLSRPIDEIFSSLEEIKRYKAELVSGANPLLQSQQYIQPSQLYPSAEIEKLNSQFASLQAQMAQTNPGALSEYSETSRQKGVRVFICACRTFRCTTK